MEPDPLKFHRMHASSIALDCAGRRAFATLSRDNGIAFSSRPIRAEERVVLHHSQLNQKCSGLLRFGVTSVDPATLSYKDLNSGRASEFITRLGYRMRQIPIEYTSKAGFVELYVSSQGFLYADFSGHTTIGFLYHIDINCPHWIVIDIQSKGKTVQFENPRAAQNDREVTSVFKTKSTFYHTTSASVATPVPMLTTPRPHQPDPIPLDVCPTLPIPVVKTDAPEGCVISAEAVALDDSAKPDKTLVEEIRKALGGPPEKLVDTLAALRDWNEYQALMAVVECVERPQKRRGEKKDKDPRGSITLTNLLNEGFEEFLSEKTANLSAKEAATMVRELETRIGDEKKDREQTRIYAHLLADFVDRGIYSSVQRHEKQKETVKQTLARQTAGLWRRGVRDASYTLALSLAYLLCPLLGTEWEDGGSEGWWRAEVMDKDKTLKKSAFFVVLTTLIGKGKMDVNDWSEVDLAEVEEGSITGAEGVLTARWILVHTVVRHATSLAARCEPAVFAQLLRIVVRAHVESEEFAPLITRLATEYDLPRESWAVVAREAVAILRKGAGSRCSFHVVQIIRGLAALPKPLIDEETKTYLEHSLILVLSAMNTEESAPLKEALGLLTWLVEEGAKQPWKQEWPAAGVQLLRCINALLMSEEEAGETHNALLALSRALLTRYTPYGDDAAYTASLFNHMGRLAGMNPTTDNDDSVTCIICYAARRDAVVVDCWHMSTCFNCAKRIQEGPIPGNRKCPICRGVIKDIQKIHVA